ncbi:hypothetical protein TNCV_2966811 [Trichonephila clavipes]|nr:hypothetical protein TNCV_2966811 [Trichonephila clavipes]
MEEETLGFKEEVNDALLAIKFATPYLVKWYGFLLGTRYEHLLSTSLVNGTAKVPFSDLKYSISAGSSKCLRDIIFQQDDARPYVARHVLSYLDTEGIRLLP